MNTELGRTVRFAVGCTTALMGVTMYLAPWATWDTVPEIVETETVETPQSEQIGEPYVVVSDDDPAFDCRYDGNQTCGVQDVGTGRWYVVTFDDGMPISIQESTLSQPDAVD